MRFQTQDGALRRFKERSTGRQGFFVRFSRSAAARCEQRSSWGGSGVLEAFVCVCRELDRCIGETRRRRSIRYVRNCYAAPVGDGKVRVGACKFNRWPTVSIESIADDTELDGAHAESSDDEFDAHERVRF